jgi:threonine synthase
MEQITEEEKPPGLTPLFRARNIERVMKMNRVFFKFEGASITGTQKDRISSLHVKRAIELGYDTVAVATCGNYGASVAYFASAYKINSVVALPSFYTGIRNDEIYGYGAKIIQKSMKYEDLVEYMKDKSRDEGWYDCSPGSVNSIVDILGYEAIANEIFQQLGHVPSYVAAPVGNGTTLAGIFSGFKKLYLKGITNSIPRFIASSTSLGNPIVYSWKHGFKKVQQLEPSTIIETETNEPLVSFRSLDGQKALNAIYDSKGVAIGVNDLDMVKYSKLIENQQSLQVLPASSSALSAASKSLSNKNYKGEVVVVLTGRGH